MNCASCSSENEPGAKFCNECGAALNAGCPNCGAANKPGAKYCNECGTELVGATGSPPLAMASGSPVAERRVVTVLFADLVEFTPFAADRDEEDVRDTLSHYFDLSSQIIGRYGGTIEKFIGDAVMAVWGAPTAHEDDAERAVRAALELVDAVAVLGPSVQARAGVLTGQAAVTVGATNQGMVAGDMVNTAARLQSVAPPGAVLVGEATYRASSNAIQFEEAGAQSLKGKESPMKAWRAVRVVAERGGRNRTESLEAPFVGRADELRLLKELFHATGRERKTRLVSVIGPGGIGKSRLAWEFLKYVDGLVDNTYWHSGRSPAYGEGITFWALGEMVRGRCELVEGDDEATTRAKVAETVARWVRDEERRTRIEKALLSLLGFESGMPSDQLFGAWRNFFERIAEAGTVALVFEDMHHADSGLLDFIEHMLEWSKGLPIYIVTLARPELHDRRSDWGAGKRNFASIFLEPLAPDQMRELIAGLVPGLPDAATTRIVERADGVPLYAVETVRMLVADGRLKVDAGVYVPVGDLTTLAVPDTLTALISSRLDGLEAADRSLVHDASVLGQSFTIGALAAVSGIAESDLEGRLKGLVRRELLTRELDPRSVEQGQYGFMQALIREVAYNTLSRKDRKVRHLAAARHFEQLDSDELASALAGHYLSAQQNAGEGPEADALAAQAHVALRGAADRAAALGAHDQAVSFLEQAVKVTADQAERAALHEKASRSADIATRSDKAAELARQAREIHTQLGDRLGAARATGLLARALLNAGRADDAMELVEAALAEYADLWPDPVIAELKIQAAAAYAEFDKDPIALRLTDEALGVAEHANVPSTIAWGLIYKGAALGGLGRLREAIALIRGGGDVAREHGLTEAVLASLGYGGYVLGELDNVAASECMQQALALARQVGNRTMVYRMTNNLGYTGFLTGDWDSPLAELDAALAEDLDIWWRIWLLSNALIIRASRGDPTAEGVAEMLLLVAEHADQSTSPASLDTQAYVALAAGELEVARKHWLDIAMASSGQDSLLSHYQAARPALWAGDVGAVSEDLAAIDASGFHGHVLEARRVTLQAGIAALEGRRHDAMSMYADALAAWRDLRMTWEEALTGIDMASVLDPAAPDIRAVAESTRQILERLGAKPYLARLDAALARPTASVAAVDVASSRESAAAGESARDSELRVRP